MSLSIVITTYNRSKVLVDLLQSLAGQTDMDFEVVVAIDGSTDDTEAVLASLEVPFDLKWVNTHCKGYGLAVARNLGILAADREIVAVIDDDCFPSPCFVDAYKRSVKRKTITGGPRTADSDIDEKQKLKMLELRRLPNCEAVTLERLHAEWPKAVATECNIAMFKIDIIEMGLFSERLKIYGFIGQEFFSRAKHLGVKYQFNSDAEIIHHRQPVGDNGLSRWKRKWQIAVASALRTSFMNERQFEVQMKWANCMSSKYPARCPLPPLPNDVWAFFPYRFIRGRAASLRRAVRSKNKT